MSSRLTWSRPDGSWGLEGVDLTKLPPRVYGALCKLKRMEALVEQIQDPKACDWLVEDLTAELVGRRGGV